MLVCPYCGEPVSQVPPDYIDYCNECELIVEGEAIEQSADED